MLAKIIKIANIKKQREFILDQLLTISEENTDGDISYLYTGYLFPEVRSYFESEGFKIEDFFNEADAFSTDFRTHHLFTICDHVKLDDNECNEAENFDYSTDDDYLNSDDDNACFSNMLNDLLAKGIHPGNTPHLVAIPVPDDINSSEKIKDFLSNIFGTSLVSAAYSEKESSEKPEDNIFNLFEDNLPKTSDTDNKIPTEFTCNKKDKNSENIDDNYEDTP